MMREVLVELLNYNRKYTNNDQRQYTNGEIQFNTCFDNRNI